MPQLHAKKAYRVLAAVGEPEQLDPLLTLSCALAQAHAGQVMLMSVTPDGQRPEWLTAPEVCNGVSVNILLRLGRHAGGAGDGIAAGDLCRLPS